MNTPNIVLKRRIHFSLLNFLIIGLCSSLGNCKPLALDLSSKNFHTILAKAL